MAMSDESSNVISNGTEQSKLATTKTTAKSTVVRAGRSKASAESESSQAIELYQPAPLPSTRPVAASSLDIVPSDVTFPGYRPISAAHLEVVDTQTLPNHRPIVKSGLVIVNSDTLPQHRPVVRSKFPLPSSNLLPNHRPIASNQIDEPSELMGFLD